MGPVQIKTPLIFFLRLSCFLFFLIKYLPGCWKPLISFQSSNKDASDNPNQFIYFLWGRTGFWSSLLSHFHWCHLNFFLIVQESYLNYSWAGIILFLCFGICPQRVLLPILDFLFYCLEQLSLISFFHFLFLNYFYFWDFNFFHCLFHLQL